MGCYKQTTACASQAIWVLLSEFFYVNLTVKINFFQAMLCYFCGCGRYNNLTIQFNIFQFSQVVSRNRNSACIHQPLLNFPFNSELPSSAMLRSKSLCTKNAIIGKTFMIIIFPLSYPLEQTILFVQTQKSGLVWLVVTSFQSFASKTKRQLLLGRLSTASLLCS